MSILSDYVDLPGTIEPGKEADVAVLSREIFVVPQDEIGKTRVLMTMAGMRLRAPLEPPARASSDY
jgi:predicted amidohydrolase YtcJ